MSVSCAFFPSLDMSAICLESQVCVSAPNHTQTNNMIWNQTIIACENIASLVNALQPNERHSMNSCSLDKNMIFASNQTHTRTHSLIVHSLSVVCVCDHSVYSHCCTNLCDFRFFYSRSFIHILFNRLNVVMWSNRKRFNLWILRDKFGLFDFHEWKIVIQHTEATTIWIHWSVQSIRIEWWWILRVCTHFNPNST